MGETSLVEYLQVAKEKVKKRKPSMDINFMFVFNLIYFYYADYYE